MYQAGIYCRVSIEEQNKEGEYSNSIHSQIQMARDYIAEQNDITEVRVYADDGFSGSNFDRTEFRRMLADIEPGTINMVIFKDVSRLGREHIDTNYYLGKYFPEKRIRVVSLLDNYDSMVSTYDELLEIKTLLNDMYLRDTSRKIKTTIQTKRSMGEYTPKHPPFGYVKSETVHNCCEHANLVCLRAIHLGICTSASPKIASSYYYSNLYSHFYYFFYFITYFSYYFCINTCLLFSC